MVYLFSDVHRSTESKARFKPRETMISDVLSMRATLFKQLPRANNLVDVTLTWMKLVLLFADVALACVLDGAATV